MGTSIFVAASVFMDTPIVMGISIVIAITIDVMAIDLMTIAVVVSV